MAVPALALCLALALALKAPATVRGQRLHNGSAFIDVFVGGTEGYKCFRIPALLALPGNVLLAYAEGRKFSCSDHDYNDIVSKRSVDGGKTWSPLSIVYGESTASHHVTIGNPAPVYEPKSGHILMPCCRNNQHVLLLASNDTGKTWSKPVDLTPSVMKPGWKWFATGPPGGIVLQSGRIIVPSDHNGGPDGWGSHAMYSDDDGRTWQSGPSVDVGNECQAAQYDDGKVLLAMRSSKESQRLLSTSTDGVTFSAPKPILTETECEGSLVVLPSSAGSAATQTAVISSAFAGSRTNMTLHTSADGGLSWQPEVQIYAGSSAYSSLQALGADSVGLLFEADGYTRIVYTAVSGLGRPAAPQV